MSSKVMLFVLMTSMYLALMTTEVVGGPGEWSVVSSNDPQVQEAAAKAKEHIDEARNSAMIYILQEVTVALVQIVKGKNYMLWVMLGETNCFRRPTVDVKNCTVVKIVKVEPCVVTVWVWQDKTTITNYSCGYDKKADGGSNGGGKTLINGGTLITQEYAVDVNSKEVIQVATFATEEMTKNSKGRYRVQLNRVVKGTTQLETKLLYKLTLEVTITSGGDKKGKKDTCKVEVWDQSLIIGLRKSPYMYILEEYKCNLLTQ